MSAAVPSGITTAASTPIMSLPAGSRSADATVRDSMSTTTAWPSIIASRRDAPCASAASAATERRAI
jgi:hypothetical protein